MMPLLLLVLACSSGDPAGAPPPMTTTTTVTTVTTVTTTTPAAPLPPAAQAAHDGCEAYLDVRAVHEVCVARAVIPLATATEADALCLRAGDSESDCRRAWANHPKLRTDVPRAELLLACASDPDCAFQVLDARPEADPVAQGALCDQHTGRFERDCVGHAVERWIATAPSEDETMRVYTNMADHLDILAGMIGRAEACGGQVRCGDGATDADKLCRTAAAEQRRHGCR